MHAAKISLPVLTALLLASCGKGPAVPLAPVADNTFLDLLAGWRLKVVSPVRNGSGPAQPLELTATGSSSFDVKGAPDLKEFETQYYSVLGARDRVKLAFSGATVTINGETRMEDKPLKRYFRLPPGQLRLRLVYLARSNGAPHDMALVFARAAGAVGPLASGVTGHPESCDAQPLHCLWIPAEVAVIAERRDPAGAEAWQPVQ